VELSDSDGAFLDMRPFLLGNYALLGKRILLFLALVEDVLQNDGEAQALMFRQVRCQDDTALPISF
jgi:hypothetical protein